MSVFDFSRWQSPPSWIAEISNLTVWTVKSVAMHHFAKCHQNRSNRGWDMAIFLFFKMAAAAIWDFWNFNFLTVVTVKSVVLHHHAKLGQNRLNRGWDITIFRFFQDGGSSPSWICNVCVGTTRGGHLVVFITVQNLVGIDAVVLIVCTFFRFREFGLKTPIHAPKWGFGGFWPLYLEQCENFPKKAHPCTSPLTQGWCYRVACDKKQRGPNATCIAVQ